MTFPNAEYYSSKSEWDFWKDNIDHPLAIDQKLFREPLEGKIKFLKDGEEIIPNLFVKYEFGHTPGLINLILNADGKRIWFMSDMVHSDLKIQNGVSLLIIMKKELLKQEKMLLMIYLNQILLLLIVILSKKPLDI